MSDGARIAERLTSYRFMFTNEVELQDGIAQVLDDADIVFQREVRLSSGDRIDFLLESGVGIEVKEIAGAVVPVLRQLQRYAASDRVSSLILVTARHCHAQLPPDVGGKPLAVVCLSGSSL